MSDRRRRPVPWPAAFAAALAVAGTLLALPPLALPLPAPWHWLAPLCMAAAAALATVAGCRARQQIERLDAALARAALAESERNALQHDVHARERLEKELLQAKQAAEAATQAAEAAVLAKGEFLATMSHEIRTPLNGIIPMLELIGRGPLGLDQREMLRAASTSSLQLLRIVDDILDYSKLEANRLELEITTFNLRELLDGVLELMQRAAEAKGLRMALQLDPAVRLPVRGDPVRLRQVLSNLLGNAVKFTARGAIDLGVRRLGETPAQHLLRFEVRDTGIGISADRQEHLFQAFTQADASTTRLYGGTGLGLTICKRIVELMGGRIGVVSRQGQGATFWFEIPLLKVIGDLPQSPGGLPRLHALLVGADQRLQQRLSVLLPNWGVQVSKVDSTQEALERLRGNGSGVRPAYDLVIGDLDGLRQSARALQRAVARLPAPQTARLIWLYGEADIPEEIRAHGALLSRQAADIDLRSMLALAPATPSMTNEAAGDGTANAGEFYHDAFATDAMHTPAPVLAADPATAVTDAPPPRSGYRLLLVEDNPVNLMVAKRLLESLGHHADSVEDGAAALAQLARQPYDLVMMDCQMPVLDGYAATRQWRQREAETGRPRLPILAMTANAMAGDRQRCLDAGMDDYLSKPIDRTRLEACLQRWLPLQPVAMPASAAFAPEPAAAAAPQTAPEIAASGHVPDTIPLAKTSAEAQPAPQGEAQAPVAAKPDAASASTVATSAPTDATDADAVVEPPAVPAPVLEIAVLDELRDVIGSASVAQIVELFLADAPLLIQRLEQAAATSEPDALREAAHTLKSSAANLGALALSAAALRIESGVRTGTLDRPVVAVALVIAEFARARLALNGYRASVRDNAEPAAP
ncbi:ATP-binding protein [Xanthomonas rydalmerensis]|uniref:histidine kinase n=1 Tax=Xanthomonas rydalmerensis TaxID=3046274 RepID=A0ABZ0JLC8_9XANT|nr:ATP-binding protein [Xanthomonas sp. DM-2023]WOS40600.1 ATP-binding protein [Xanthomonas sp. DM-2023]WOS44784.1 ATP-binding protein [Xanthomonas sp. DM-2023]WOS48964.1 ATP-binding protein [Xanthomonas sp. DM-2023]WOS53144.1 ATP-binding protein [Xanthomonas sp. DM-2023]WOS57327.1 ATP-binding protein [Xanthomonas sp. DM-2023]